MLVKALARAVYSRKQIMLFDGIFSQLDTSVQATIFANLFGPEGLFRKWGTTIILTTHEGNALYQVYWKLSNRI